MLTWYPLKLHVSFFRKEYRHVFPNVDLHYGKLPHVA